LNGSNVDANDDKNSNHKEHNDGENSIDRAANMESNNASNKPTPERWILVLALIVLASGVVLLALRSVIFSMVFITIGISLFAYWLYVGVRSKEQLHLLNQPDDKATFSSAKSRVNEGERVCTCSICKHHESNACMQVRCPCCILTRNRQIIGHFNNPLQ
jgi:hypothetical protein